MTDVFETELYLQDDPEFRSVRLYVHEDGSLRIWEQDVEERVEEVSGDEDYEFLVDVPAKALRKLVFALMREKYMNQSDAVDRFRAFCEQEAIEHEWQSWA